MTDYRVGIGYDIHRLAEGRALMLGGVPIPHDKGLLGHSDGDVLLHAVTDALLGACGQPDIGELFPDTDPQHKDADSKRLLTVALERCRPTGYKPHFVDCIIHAEKPKLSAHKRIIAQSVASLLGINPECVSVKAKTNEGLGPVGAGDAIAATVALTLIKRD